VSAAIDVNIYSDVLVVLGTAGLIVPVMRRFGISPVLGYLAAGALLGPLGLGSLIAVFPVLYWVTIGDAGNVASIGDLGVVFLLFLIGLELSYQRLMTMRRLVFGMGGLQVAVSTILISAVASLAGAAPAVSLIIGSCLALSSTAIVIEVLSLQGRMSSGAGRASFAVLLAQDIAVIPILLFVSILAGGTHGSVITSVLLALLNAAVAVGGIVVVGRLLFRPVFRLVASAASTELFVAATLFVIIGAGVAAALAGLSMALGAFVAGLLLAETEFRQGDRDDDRTVQGAASGPVLLRHRHEDGHTRISARAFVALCRRAWPDPCEVRRDDRPCAVVPPVLACRVGNRVAAGPGGGVCLCRHRHGNDAGSCER
jgi:CPA2 family monovalent cation:H+ antiporter-2